MTRKVIKGHHAIIYSGENEPDPHPYELPGENEAGMRRSIRVDLRLKRDAFHPMSRINLNMSYLVQHNVEVYDMGMVAPEYRNILLNEYMAVNFSQYFRYDEEDEENELESPVAENSDIRSSSAPKKKKKRRRSNAVA